MYYRKNLIWKQHERRFGDLGFGRDASGWRVLEFQPSNTQGIEPSGYIVQLCTGSEPSNQIASAYAGVCIYIYTYIFNMYVCMYVRMYVCTHVCVYVCRYVCMYVYIYILYAYAYTTICIHTHTHTHP